MSAQALAILAERGQWRIDRGLTDAELADIEAKFGIRFSDQHRDFLAAGLPVGSGWPDWRSADEIVLRAHLGRAVRELLQSVRERKLWHPAWGERPEDAEAVKTASRALAQEPRVIPVYGVAFLRQGRGAVDRTVWAIQDHDVCAVAADLIGLAQTLTGQSVPTSHVTARPFLPEPVVPQVPDLDVPPFASDPTLQVPAAVRPPTDPAERYATLGVTLPELTRHDDVLAHRAPMWSMPVPPGREATALWSAVRAQFSNTGLWPVLFSDPTWHRIGLDGIADPTSVLTAELDGARWLSDAYADRTRNYQVARYQVPFRSHADDGDWQQLFNDLNDRRAHNVLVLVPTPADWLVPGLLQWSGAVNYDVDGLAHAAVLRRWSGRYGTELVALDDEFLTVRVERPPRDGQAALAAAVEGWLYCDDAVNTETGSLDALAGLMTYRLWTFWWD